MAAPHESRSFSRWSLPGFGRIRVDVRRPLTNTSQHTLQSTNPPVFGRFSRTEDWEGHPTPAACAGFRFSARAAFFSGFTCLAHGLDRREANNLASRIGHSPIRHAKVACEVSQSPGTPGKIPQLLILVRLEDGVSRRPRLAVACLCHLSLRA